MSCPNGDPAFNKVLQQLVGESSPNTRKYIYYYVCIWVRLVLYGAVWLFREKAHIPFLVGVPSAYAVYHLSTSPDGEQWWSKKFQLGMALLITFACVSRVVFKTNSTIIPALLFFSLFGGVAQSVFVKWC